MTIPLWRNIQKQNFTKLSDLLDFLQLSDSQKFRTSKYPLNLPRRLAEKIKKKDLTDPILRQFLPLNEEHEDSSFPLEPVQDSRFRQGGKLLKKYEGRALLLLSSSCAMNCRFCFRQHFPYEKEEKGFENEILKIRSDRTIAEVILSGGDPLTLSNETLNHLIQELSEIAHVKRLRFHTRFPIGIPERIDEGFLGILENTSLQTWFVIHTNHVSEWDQEVISAHKKIQKLGIPILSQSVLLKGVNDSFDALNTLFHFLIDIGIMPYYLHQLDQVKGASHFEVDIEQGLKIMRELSAQMSGYGIPRYVQEIPGEEGKTVLY